MPQKNRMINLSIIIPVYNESSLLNYLFRDLEKYFNNNDIEILFVNDGSTDNSKSIIENYIKNKNNNFNIKLINFDINYGKGKAVREGIQASSGNYVLLQDADLELDLKDSKELFDLIKINKNIKCIFGSRYSSGKLKKNNYFFNQIIGKINSIIFNLLFSQSLSDIHCGLKILHRDVINKLNLSINDFGLEIDIASQIARNNFFIYEYGVSYYFRTKAEGKKITWLDGLKSYYYLFKVRFIDNEFSINLSILFSSLYMAYVGSYFGSGTGKTLFIIIFLIIGLFIGLKNKIIPSSLIFLFIYIGSLIGNGQGKIISIIIFFTLGIYLAGFLKNFINKKNTNFILKYLF